MRQVLRQRLRGAFVFSSVSATVSALVTPFFFGFQAVPLMNGFVIGFFASFFIMALNATALDRAAAKLAVWQLFSLGFAAYAAIIAGVAFVSFRVTGADALFGAGQLYTFSLAFGIAFSLVANAVIAVAGIVGSAELVQLLVGRYHRPALERRAFLFMDLRGSTAAAEALGDERFLSFLNEAYADLGEAAVATRAQIYKYVGDEIILTWRPGRRAAVASAVGFFRAAEEALLAKDKSYLSRYGLVPRFRAGCHLGSVVTGQLGLLKKEITYLGDVMNSASRIMDESKRLGYGLIISEAAYEGLDAAGRHSFADLGQVELRGKSRPMRLYGLVSGGEEKT